MSIRNRAFVVFAVFLALLTVLKIVGLLVLWSRGILEAEFLVKQLIWAAFAAGLAYWSWRKSKES